MKNIARPVLPEFSSKAELYFYLRSNVKSLIAQKKAFPIVSEDFEFGYSVREDFVPVATKKTGKASDNTDNEIAVDVIGNLSGWCDSYRDVMIKDNWNKSISDNGASGQKLVYHLKNHEYSTDAIIGKDSELYTKDIELSRFNIKTDIKKAQALMMGSIVCREYDSKCFMLYRDGQIKQHSIGLQYMKMYLCMNSEEAEDAMYKENWEKYYPQVINKELVDKGGYFWAVTEAKILEVSAVLFGANELTPVESTNQSSKGTTTEPPAGTQEEPPSTVEEVVKEINWDRLASSLLN